jgi:hypothetical protein
MAAAGDLSLDVASGGIESQQIPGRAGTPGLQLGQLGVEAADVGFRGLPAGAGGGEGVDRGLLGA